MMRPNRARAENVLANKKKRAENSARLVGLAYGQDGVLSGYLPELDVEAGCD